MVDLLSFVGLARMEKAENTLIVSFLRCSQYLKESGHGLESAASALLEEKHLGTNCCHCLSINQDHHMKLMKPCVNFYSILIGHGVFRLFKGQECIPRYHASCYRGCPHTPGPRFHGNMNWTSQI